LGNDNDTEKMPKEWNLFASIDGETWVILDVRREETSWKKNEARTFIIDKPSTYKHYRLTLLRGNDPNVMRLYSLKLLD